MVENVCRICFEERHDMVELFSEEEISKALISTIKTCFRIKLSYDQILPTGICDFCRNDLEAAKRFMHCLSVDKSAKKHLETKIDGTEYDGSSETLDGISDRGSKMLLIKDAFRHEEFQSLAIPKNIICSNKFKFECESCGKILKTRISLQRHEFKLHGIQHHNTEITQNQKFYKCLKCSYSTTYSQTFVNHMRRHNGERPFKCDCGKSFTQYSSLNAHRKSLHSNLKQFTCPECGKQFKLAYTLKTHLNVHASGTYICDICKKKLKSKTSLQYHILRHYNVHNYSCEDCGSTFVTSSELINHKKKHRLGKKFECFLCGHKTNSKRYLTVHMNRHTGNRPHKCELCDKSFFNASNLRRHHRSHTKEKPYSCSVCNQKFMHNSSRQSHLKNVHNVHHLSLEIKPKFN